LGARRSFPMHSIHVEADDPEPVEVDAVAVVREVRGTVCVLGARPPPGRLAVVFEPMTRALVWLDRRQEKFAGPAAFVDEDGAFAVITGLGERVPTVVDTATGVVLGRLPSVLVERSTRTLELGNAAVRCVRARVRLGHPAFASVRADHLEVDV